MDEEEFNYEGDDSEISIYANEQDQINQIPEIIKVSDKRQIKALKISHSNLSNLIGIQEFKSLIKLELCSNKISSINLCFKGLKHIRILNVSCNMLTNVNGIEYLISLEELNLSHNKITNLDAFNLLSDSYVGKERSPLSTLDLRDNLISSLNQLIYIEKFSNLTYLMLQERDGYNHNPICTMENYVDFIIENLPQVKMLDNRDISSYNMGRYNPQNNIKSEINNKTINYSSPFIHDIKYKNFLSNVTGGGSNNFRTLSNNRVNPNNINVYKEQIKNLHNNIEELFNDQRELVFKYEKNESYWKNKVDDLSEIIRSLKEQINNYANLMDEKEFLVRELTNKIALREQEVASIKRLYDDKELLNTDMNTKFALLKKDYEFSLIDNEKLAKKIQDVNKEYELLTQENRKLKEELTKEENFYKELAQKKTDELNIKIRAINVLENKVYDFSKTFSDKQKEIESLLEMNNYLQTNINKYNKIKNETEFELGSKFEKEKEDLNRKYKSQIEDLENNFKRMMNHKDEEFLKDMKIIEKSYDEMIKNGEDQIAKLKRDNDKLNLALNDCRELLKMSLLNEEKNEKLIKDLEKVNNEYLIEKENLSNKYEIEKENLTTKIKLMELEIKEQVEQNCKVEQTIKNMKNNIIEKDNELNTIYEENQKLKKNFSLANAKSEKFEKEISFKNDEINTLKFTIQSDPNIKKIEELNDIIKTKNMMLDDQSKQLIELKYVISEKESDLSNQQIKEDKIRQKYEKKINQMKKDFEEANSHIDHLNKTIQEYEDIVSNLRLENEKSSNEINELNFKLNEKKEITQLIEKEINDIKDFYEMSQKQINEKNAEIKNLKDIIEELNKNLINKNKECRDIIQHFESYKLEKSEEIKLLHIKIEEAQNDMIVILNEYEKQKNVIKTNIQNINNMFGI